MEPRKMGLMNLFAGQQWRCRHSRLVDTMGEGEGGTNQGSSTDIYTLPCVKQAASRKLLYSRGSSAWCPAMTWRGGMVGDGREVQEGGSICMHSADSHSCTVETNTTL